jgi:hypothetical protein
MAMTQASRCNEDNAKDDAGDGNDAGVDGATRKKNSVTMWSSFAHAA